MFSKHEGAAYSFASLLLSRYVRSLSSNDSPLAHKKRTHRYLFTFLIICFVFGCVCCFCSIRHLYSVLSAAAVLGYRLRTSTARSTSNKGAHEMILVTQPIRHQHSSGMSRAVVPLLVIMSCSPSNLQVATRLASRLVLDHTPLSEQVGVPVCCRMHKDCV